MNIKNLFNNEAGVSPIVATLVLVVVAIAGAAAVGTIMGSFSSDVSDQANTDDLSSGASTEIVVAGSTTVQPVSELLAKAYMAENSGVKVTVQAGGSSAGIASAGMGIVDIGAASKFASDDDKTKFPDLEEHIIGGSAVVVITNENGHTAGIENVSKADLQMLYNGSDVTSLDGMSTGKVIVYHRQEGSGTEETFAGYLFDSKNVDDAKADEASGFTTEIDTAVGNQGVLDAVKSSDDVAIGFVDYGFADGTDGVYILGLDTDDDGTVEFTEANMDVKDAVKDLLADKDSSTYYEIGLCRPLVYLTNGAESSVTNDYLSFAMSPAALEYFDECGYFGITDLQ